MKLVTTRVMSEATDKVNELAREIREGNTVIRIMSCTASVCNSEVACAAVYVSDCDLGSYDGLMFESVVDYIASSIL